jgi:hypothetical protein
MARIQTYNSDVKVTQNDSWIGTDGDSSNKTKNFTPNKVADYLNSSEKIDKSNTITFTYQTLDFEESRSPGTISFDLSQPPYVPFSSITNILVSKISNGFKTVDVFLSGTNETTIILQRGNSVNEYGLYNVVSIDEHLEDNNFFVFTLDFIQGNGGLNEDKEYLFSVVDFSKAIKIHNNLQGLNDGDYIHLTQEEKDTFDYLTDNFPVNTSDLINDGADGINPFITLEDIPPIDISSKLDKDFSTFTDKSTPIDADLIPLYDGANKKLSWSNVKVTLKSYFDTIYQAALGFTPENVANKATNLISPDNTKYPTTQAVVDGLATKQDTLTNPVTGTGVTNFLPKFTGVSTLGDSQIFDNGTNVGIGVANPTRKLQVNGVTFISAAAEGNTALSDAAPLIVQNTLPYANPFGQYLQIWRNSSGSTISSLRADGSFQTATSFLAQNFGASNNGNGTSVLTFYRSNNGIWFPNGNSLGINTNGSERMRITDTGNVTIGATTAGARLDVRAQGALSTDIAFRVRNSADTANLLSVNGVGLLNVNDNLFLQNDKGLYFNSTSLGINASSGVGTLRLVTNSINRLIIDNNGNINSINSPTARFSDILITGSNIEFRNGIHFFSWENTGNVFQIKNITNSNTIPFIVFKNTNNIGISTTTDVASAVLNVNSTTKGFLPPRMTNAQRLAIASPAVGLMVYCTDATEGLYINKSTGWQFII